MSVCRECFVLSGRGLCDRLIAHPEEAYRLGCVWGWGAWPTGEGGGVWWCVALLGKISLKTLCNEDRFLSNPFQLTIDCSIV